VSAVRRQDARSEGASEGGYWLVLDQCPQCGGIWCDRWELFPITALEAARLDTVDQEHLLQAVPVAAASGECPRCRARLRLYRDPALPPDARIERCPNCEGLWLNRGALRRVKGQPLAPTPTAPKFADAELDRLVQNIRDPQAEPTVTNLDAAWHERGNSPESDDAVRALATGAGWLVVRAALRLLLHW